jgi:hypothetical protein
MQRVRMLFHRAPEGWIRVSRADRKSEGYELFEPIYKGKKASPLSRGGTKVVGIPLRPLGMFWKVFILPFLLRF